MQQRHNLCVKMLQLKRQGGINMAKRYGINIKSQGGGEENRWYSSPGKRMRAMATLRRRVVDDENCAGIRFIEGNRLKLVVTYLDKKPKTFEYVTQEELDKARNKFEKDKNVTSTFLGL